MSEARENSQERNNNGEDEAPTDTQTTAKLESTQQNNEQGAVGSEGSPDTPDDETSVGEEYKKDSILLDPNVTPLDVLLKYQTVKQRNDNRIEMILKKEGRLLNIDFTPPASTDSAPEEIPSPSDELQRNDEEGSEDTWSVIPSTLTLQPPYALMDTVELETSVTEERPFRAIVLKNPSDWLLRVLPDTGLLSSSKYVGLLITCESKNIPMPEERSTQKGTIQIFVENQMKELEVSINYMPVHIGKWLPAGSHPGRRSTPAPSVHQPPRMTDRKNSRKMKMRKSDEPSDISITVAKSADNFDTSTDDLRKKLKGITLNHIKATANLKNPPPTREMRDNKPTSLFRKKKVNNSGVLTRGKVSVPIIRKKISMDRSNQFGDLTAVTERETNNELESTDRKITGRKTEDSIPLIRKQINNLIEGSTLSTEKINMSGSTTQKKRDNKITSFISIARKKIDNQGDDTAHETGGEKTENLISMIRQTMEKDEGKTSLLLTKTMDSNSINIFSPQRKSTNIVVNAPVTINDMIHKGSDPFIMTMKSENRGSNPSSPISKKMETKGSGPLNTKRTDLKDNDSTTLIRKARTTKSKVPRIRTNKIGDKKCGNPL